jgi:hypothetical protein
MRPQPDFLHEFVPANSSRTLLLLHGTGGNERDLIPLGRELDPNASLLSPRGKILENGMPRFFRRLAEGVFDLEDLKTRTNELADFAVAAVPLQTRCGRCCWCRLFQRRQHRWKHLIASAGNYARGDSISCHGAANSRHIARPFVCVCLDRRR